MIDASGEVTPRRVSVKETHDGHATAKKNSHNAARRGQWTAEFRAWRQMRSRCYNPRMNGYENYGGRGIKVCDAWVDSFENFLADMGTKPTSRHSLDRINNDGNYEPANCKWATKLEQDNNRRTNRFISFMGRRMTIAQWARRIGISVVTLNSRFQRGWSKTAALSRPIWKR